MNNETLIRMEYEKKLAEKEDQINSLLQTIRDILDPKNQALIEIYLNRQVTK